MLIKEYDYLVFLGRFQPFHIGHFDVVKKALEKSYRVIMIVGSYDKAPDIRNPIDSYARETIIRDTLARHLTPDEYARVYIRHQADHTYNEPKWLASIQQTVANITIKSGWRDKSPRIGVIGYDKDHTTFYLHKFPQWKTVHVDQEHDVNATQIRNTHFGQIYSLSDDWFIDTDHRQQVKEFLVEATDRHNLIAEWEFVQDYKELWKSAPYPVNFLTCDAVVIQSAHILVVERGDFPGKGQIALPGGHLNQKEKLEDGVIRELREESGLKVPDPVLRGSIVKSDVFDDPERSTRGRTVTYATYFRLADQEKLPRIKGMDDAKAAWWMPISKFQANRRKIFEDHYSIVENLTGL